MVQNYDICSFESFYNGIFSVTPTKNKKEKKDENFQSPRKIQSINILRRKRTQVKF